LRWGTVLERLVNMLWKFSLHTGGKSLLVRIASLWRKEAREADGN